MPFTGLDTAPPIQFTATMTNWDNTKVIDTGYEMQNRVFVISYDSHHKSSKIAENTRFRASVNKNQQTNDIFIA